MELKSSATCFMYYSAHVLSCVRRHMYALFDKDQDEPMHFNDGLRRIHPDDVVSTAIAVE
jgi:hypothetical protein